MSLRAFHIFFILCSVALLVGMGIWQMDQPKTSLSLLAAIGFLAGGAGLGIYLVWFLKKIRQAKS